MVGGLEPRGVVDVVGVERDAEEAGIGTIDAADARRKAGTRTGGCGAAQSRHLAIDHFHVEVGQFDIVAVGLRVTSDNRRATSLVSQISRGGPGDAHSPLDRLSNYTVFLWLASPNNYM